MDVKQMEKLDMSDADISLDVSSMSLENYNGDDRSSKFNDSHFEQSFTDEVILPEVQRRVLALKNIHLSVADIEIKYYKEIHEIQSKYLSLYQEKWNEREKIITGEYEPTEKECTFGDTFTEYTVKKPEEINDNVKNHEMEKTLESDTEEVSGIPNFWLSIFENVDELNSIMEKHDYPILSKLTDIKIELMKDPMGFMLHFHFAPNEYFTNSVLTKTYELNCEVDKDYPFAFEGAKIVNCKGCTIDWKEGNNITIRVYKKQVKNRTTGLIRTVVRNATVPSFFNFFSPPKPLDASTEDGTDESIQGKLSDDFALGEYFRNDIIPNAVYFYTGEALEEEFYEDDELVTAEDIDDDNEDTIRKRFDRALRFKTSNKLRTDCNQQ